MNRKMLCVMAAAAALLGGCKKPETAGRKLAGDAGPTVKFSYTLTVEGKQVDSSVGKEPLTATLGSGEIIPGLEDALAGMKAGEKRNVVVPPEKGYGAYREAGVQKVPKTSFKDSARLKPGMVVSGKSNGQPFQAMVREISEKEITLDLNHPLAGKTLNFDIEVLSVQPAGS